MLLKALLAPGNCLHYILSGKLVLGVGDSVQTNSVCLAARFITKKCFIV